MNDGHQIIIVGSRHDKEIVELLIAATPELARLDIMVVEEYDASPELSALIEGVLQTGKIAFPKPAHEAIPFIEKDIDKGKMNQPFYMSLPKFKRRNRRR